MAALKLGGICLRLLRLRLLDGDGHDAVGGCGAGGEAVGSFVRLPDEAVAQELALGAVADSVVGVHPGRVHPARARSRLAALVVHLRGAQKIFNICCCAR